MGEKFAKKFQKTNEKLRNHCKKRMENVSNETVIY